MKTCFHNMSGEENNMTVTKRIQICKQTKPQSLRPTDHNVKRRLVQCGHFWAALPSCGPPLWGNRVTRTSPLRLEEETHKSMCKATMTRAAGWDTAQRTMWATTTSVFAERLQVSLAEQVHLTKHMRKLNVTLSSFILWGNTAVQTQSSVCTAGHHMGWGVWWYLWKQAGWKTECDVDSGIDKWLSCSVFAAELLRVYRRVESCFAALEALVI